ncbi:MAG: hypothetical protein IT293_21080 [Deltaproteobacteria bacterium]|nr:hypothetical protein [Deltaproteobacteria bacterium]
MVRLLLSMLLAVAACTSPPARDPAVVEDVLEYVQKIKKWEPVEAETLKAIKDVRTSQFVDDEYVVATLGAVMDDMQLHLAEVERYQPRTAPVTEVHERYRKAWNDLHAAFTSVIEAMQRKDYFALSKGTESLRTSRQELLLVAAAIDILLEDSGLKDQQDAAKRARS